MKINKIEEGQEKIREFVRGLIERAHVKEEDRAKEEERLFDLVHEKMLDEILMALPEEDLDEIERTLDAEGDVPMEKLNSMMFVAGVKPESVTGKVFTEIEREYLGVENVERDEDLIQAEEEE